MPSTVPGKVPVFRRFVSQQCCVLGEMSCPGQKPKDPDSPVSEFQPHYLSISFYVTWINLFPRDSIIKHPRLGGRWQTFSVSSF